MPWQSIAAQTLCRHHLLRSCAAHQAHHGATGVCFLLDSMLYIQQKKHTTIRPSRTAQRTGTEQRKEHDSQQNVPCCLKNPCALSCVLNCMRSPAQTHMHTRARAHTKARAHVQAHERASMRTPRTGTRARTSTRTSASTRTHTRTSTLTLNHWGEWSLRCQ